MLCEDVRLEELASAEGTPLYVYSAGTIASRYRAIDEAFRTYPHALHYALKANSTLAIARLVRGLGAGADANSGGEIDVALRAGFIPEQIVFTGVGKTPAELAQAIDLNVRTINAESEGELERIDLLARERQTRARVALRVNPTSTPAATRTSRPPQGQQVRHRDGCGPRDCPAAPRRDGLEIVGLHTHVGSQITELDPLRRAAAAVVTLARELRDDGIMIDHLDLGGGLGVSYDGSKVPTVEEYAAALLPAVKDSGLAIILEPGRNIVATAGALLSRVVDVKDRPDGKVFIILDAGMTELIRPMLYGPPPHRGAESTSAPNVIADIVGPLCESSDTLGKDRRLPRPGPANLFAVLDTGAYGAVMASNYNRRPCRPRCSSTARTVGHPQAQTIDDLLALES